MPQATLMGYFTPIRPAPPKTLPTSNLHRLAAATSTTSPIANAKPVLIGIDSNAEKAEAVPSVQASVLPTTSTGNQLDYFIPDGQPHAAIVRVLSSHMSRLKSITSTLLPVRYPDKFFNECLEDEIVADLSRVLLWDSQPVGWIRCRLEENDQQHRQLYVQALGILAPYRGLGLATHLIQQILQPAIIQKYRPTSIYCHVWESNHDALDWYERRGFRRIILVDQYYRRLRPAGAWIMRKEIR